MRAIVATALLLWVTGVTASDVDHPSAIPVEAFAQLPQLSGVSLSPDGSHIAYIRPVRGTPHLAIERLRPDPGIILIAPVDQQSFRWVEWANDDRVVFLASVVDQANYMDVSRTFLFGVDRDGSNLLPIVKPPKVTDTSSRVPRDGPPPRYQGDIVSWLLNEPNHILVAIDEERNNRYGVRKIDVRNGDYEILRNGVLGSIYWLADADGIPQLAYGYADSRYTYRDTDFIATRIAADGEWHTLENPRWHERGYWPVAATEDPLVYLMKGPGDSGHEVIRKVNVETGELGEVVLAGESVDVDDAVIDRRNNRLVGADIVEHLRHRVYTDVTMTELQRSIERVLPDRSNLIAGMSADSRQLVVYSTSDVVPGEYYYWDRDARSFALLGETMPGLAPELLAPTVPVEYESRDGLTIHAYLTVPLGREARDLPVVVMPHDGPDSRASKDFDYVVQFLASRGYVVFQPNFRGSTGYGKEFEASGHGQWGAKMQDDVTDGTRWLIGEGIADPDRICLVGAGYGGYAAMMGLVREPNLYHCAASIDGVMNLPLEVDHLRKYLGTDERIEFMEPENGDLRSVSPYHQADSIDAPVLIIQAPDSVAVLRIQGQNMFERLGNLDKDVRYVEVEWGGHDFRNEKARAEVLQSLETFLEASIGAGW